MAEYLTTAQAGKYLKNEFNCRCGERTLEKHRNKQNTGPAFYVFHKINGVQKIEHILTGQTIPPEIMKPDKIRKDYQIRYLRSELRQWVYGKQDETALANTGATFCNIRFMPLSAGSISYEFNLDDIDAETYFELMHLLPNMIDTLKTTILDATSDGYYYSSYVYQELVAKVEETTKEANNGYEPMKSLLKISFWWKDML